MKKGIILAAGLCTALMADPYGTAPGTKARGMGGAFTAVANNNSAIYFNPAGLIVWEEGQEEFNAFTAEIGTGMVGDVEKIWGGDDYMNDYTNYFWGVTHFGQEVGFGVGSYSLYSNNNPYNTGTLTMIEQENKIFAFAGALKLTDSLYPSGGKISVGATLGYAWTYDFWSSEVDPDQADADSVLWSIALKARLYQSDEFNLDFGFNYRAETDYQPRAFATVDVVPWDIPEETAIGLAASIPTEFANVVVAYDYKETGYESATTPEPDGNIYTTLNPLPDVTTHSLGVELGFEQFQVRAGYYTGSTDESTGYNALESNGLTAGAGLTVDEWNFEVAIEKRNIEGVDGSGAAGIDEDATFYSLSANYVF